AAVYELVALLIAGVFVILSLRLISLIADRRLGGPGSPVAVSPAPMPLLPLVAAVACQVVWAGTNYSRKISASITALLGLIAIAWTCRELLGYVAMYWHSESAWFVGQVIRTTANIAAWSAVLNLVPLPPLMAAAALSALSPKLYEQLRRAELALSIALILGLVVLSSYPTPQQIQQMARL